MTYALSIDHIQDILVDHQLLRYVCYQDEKKEKIQDKAIRSSTVQQLTYDSRQAHENSLFICKGASFKRDYLVSAYESGIKFYLSEQDYQLANAYAFIVSDIRKAMAILAQAFYQYPDQKLKLIGITATKGKTTTCYYCKDILEANFPGQVAFISGEEMSLDGIDYQSSELSTPESLDLYHYLSQAVEHGMKYLVLEISSQAYKLDRVYGLHLDVGLFMNITKDHVSPDEHESLDEYFACKRQIIHQAQRVILSNQLPQLGALIQEAQTTADQLIVYGSERKNADYVFTAHDSHSFILEATKEDNLSVAGQYKLAMPGQFNMDNACAAILACQYFNTDKDKTQAALRTSTVPGRMETYQLKKGTTVIIDFAHNQASLEAVMSYVDQAHPSGHSTVVIGSQGHRSDLRWSGIAQVLSEYGDKVYLTADDSGYTPTRTISKEIAKRITSDIDIHMIDDREEAIMTALKEAKPEDVLILAGKGTETSQFIDGENQDYIGDLQCVLNFINQENSN